MTAIALSSCMVGPKYEAPEVIVPGDWQSQDDRIIEGQPQDAALWWKSFNDPVLDSLVEEALAENLTVQMAGLRIVQARSSRNRAWQTQLPFPSLEGSVSHNDLSQNVTPEVEVAKPEIEVTPGVLGGGGGGGGLGVLPTVTVTEKPSVKVSDEIDVYDVGGSVLWEVDLWGSRKRLINAADAQLDATIANYDDVVVLLCSEVASTYVQIRVVDERIALLQRKQAVLEEIEDAATKLGQSTNSAQTEVHLSRTALLNLRAAIPELESTRSQLENALSILLGEVPGSVREKLATGEGIPAATGSIVAGIPMDLVRRRPDVRRAERLAAAQCEEIGRAKARLYPSFSLFGALGFASSDSDNLFDDRSDRHAYGVLFDWDILLYTLIQERVRLEDAQYQEAILGYQQSVLNALREVEDSFTGFVKSGERRDLLAESSVEADEALKLSLAVYRDAGGNFSQLLDSVNYSIAQGDATIVSTGATTLHMIRSYKALGGGWEVQVGRPLVPDATVKEMKERTNWNNFGANRRLTGPR